MSWKSIFLFISYSFINIAFFTAANRNLIEYDLTNDGKVDNRELRTVAYMNYKLQPTISDSIFRRTDRNHDDLLDRNEIIAAARLLKRHAERTAYRWLEEHDSDGDGLLNELELFESAYMEHGLSSHDINNCFQENDVNNDKHLTCNELVDTLYCIYDADQDHRLNLQEAQVLASIRYDVEPDFAALAFQRVSHRSDNTINELELVDLLTDLRKEAAIFALNKLSNLDRNGDEAVSFNELLQGYEKQIKKNRLKKIFNKVDVNQNAHIDPIEFVSLQNLVADEMHQQTTQANNYEEKRKLIAAVTTTPKTLIIFKSPKKTRALSFMNRKKRHTNDLKHVKDLLIENKNEAYTRELFAVNASNINFTTVSTTVPKYMMRHYRDQKHFSNKEQIIAKEHASTNKSATHKDMLRTGRIEEKLASVDPTTRSLEQTNQINSEATEAGKNKNAVTEKRSDRLTNDPRIAYIQKFEKFIGFLQKTINKLNEVAIQNKKNESDYIENYIKGISVSRRSNCTAESNKLNAEEDYKITIPEISITIKSNNDSTGETSQKDVVNLSKLCGLPQLDQNEKVAASKNSNGKAHKENPDLKQESKSPQESVKKEETDIPEAEDSSLETHEPESRNTSCKNDKKVSMKSKEVKSSNEINRECKNNQTGKDSELLCKDSKIGAKNETEMKSLKSVTEKSVNNEVAKMKLEEVNSQSCNITVNTKSLDKKTTIDNLPKVEEDEKFRILSHKSMEKSAEENQILQPSNKRMLEDKEATFNTSIPSNSTESDLHQTLQPKTIMPVTENIKDENGIEVHTLINDDNFNLLKPSLDSMEKRIHQIIVVPSIDDEDDFFNEIHNTTNQASAKSSDIVAKFQNETNKLKNNMTSIFYKQQNCTISTSDQNTVDSLQLTRVNNEKDRNLQATLPTDSPTQLNKVITSTSITSDSIVSSTKSVNENILPAAIDNSSKYNASKNIIDGNSIGIKALQKKYKKCIKRSQSSKRIRTPTKQRESQKDIVIQITIPTENGT
ncbi:unnamed protein product [Thelazia callipaeda]|uniref:EF-hand domain-containing protein n=1 Tax=Thelazia callipaeda TaxID=103827 RepID=A0A0N5CLP1_THECL|nr:unnamed protein product [Thelazia callipaeda]